MKMTYSSQLFAARRCGFLLSFSFLTVYGIISRAAAPNDNWDDRFSLPGVNGSVQALTTIGTNVYVGGRFTQAGLSNINYVARWDGRGWSPLGGGISNLASYNDFVYALAPSGTNLYVGGAFRVVASNVISSMIAKWDGSNWSALGVGITVNDPDVNAVVNAIAVVGNNVYAGGSFKGYGAMTGTNIAQWNGTAWSNMGGGVNGTVYALAVIGNNLYVGGQFTINGSPASNLAKWDGNSWSSISGIGSGTSAVSDLAVYNGELYVFRFGGELTKWNGSAWSTPSHTNLFGILESIGVDGGHLYLSGTTPGPGPAQSRLARWDGLGWAIVGNDGDFGTHLLFMSLAVCHGGVYLGGFDNLTTAIGLAPNYIVKWESDRWLGLGQGLDFAVNTLLASGMNVYAGGMVRAGGHAVNKIARWDGSRWHPLGVGLTAGSSVTAIAGNDTNLFVAGTFITAGGAAANRVARWDGANWWPLGTGIPAGIPNALAVSGNNLYVAGSFTSVGGVGATNIARWDGTNWWPLGNGIDNTVYALAANGNDLYVGGVFTKAGAVNTTCVARWDGTNWFGYGSDFASSTVLAIAGSGTNLYIGGGIFNFGGPALNNIARWNGSSWSPLGSGIAGSVAAMVVRGNELWVSGGFTTAGGITANRIAKWNGLNWSPLGSGMATIPSGSYATALALLGNDLYASGGFDIAGGKRARYITIWHEPKPNLSAGFIPNNGFVISWNSELNQTYQVYSTGDLSQPLTPLSALIPSTSTTTSYTNLSANAAAQFYQVQQVIP